LSLRRWDRTRLILSVAGLVVAAYLTALHFDTRIPLICVSTPTIDCASVLESAYSSLFGLPVALFGAFWFLLNIGLSWASVQTRGAEPAALRWAGLGWAFCGALFVVYLLYTELVLIGQLCLWCTAVHALVLFLFAVSALTDRLRGGERAAEFGGEG